MQKEITTHPTVVTFLDIDDYYVVTRTDEVGGVRVVRDRETIFEGSVFDLVKDGEYYSISVSEAIKDQSPDVLIDTTPAESVGEAAMWVSGDQNERNRFNKDYWRDVFGE